MIQLAREQFKWVSVHIHMYRKKREGRIDLVHGTKQGDRSIDRS